MPSLQSAVHPHLHFTTLQVLSASSFNRASSSATNVLTDLLSRYLDLLALTCSQYAQHAGRTSANLYDALAALEEVGVDVNELMDWSKTEAAEFDKLRESVPAADDHKEQLAALRENLREGTKRDQSDAIHLTFEKEPTPPTSSSLHDSPEKDLFSDDSPPPAFNHRLPAAKASRSPSPALPLSPVSNPALDSPPPRKRNRTTSWAGDPPSYIYDFLPPFPGRERPLTNGDTHDNTWETWEGHSSDVFSPLAQTSGAQHEIAGASEKRSQKRKRGADDASGSAANASPYHTITPYSQSSLASVSEWHLPPEPARPPPRLIESTHPFLLSAFNTQLTTHELNSQRLGQANPARLRLAVLQADNAFERYTVPETLFSSSSTSLPRSGLPMPSYATHLSEINNEGETKDKDAAPLPPPIARTVTDSGGPLNPVPPYMYPQMPRLARAMLTSAIYERTTKQPPPKPLIDPSIQKPLLYGRTVPAPWNAPPQPDGAQDADRKQKDGKPRLADAMLHGTWDYSVKSFSEPLRKAQGGPL